MDVFVRIEFVVLHEIVDGRKKLKIEDNMKPADDGTIERDDVIDVEAVNRRELV